MGIDFDAVLFQKQPELLTKIYLAMMFRLIVDVLHGVLCLGNPHAEASISLLPGKTVCDWAASRAPISMMLP